VRPDIVFADLHTLWVQHLSGTPRLTSDRLQTGRRDTVHERYMESWSRVGLCRREEILLEVTFVEVYVSICNSLVFFLLYIFGLSLFVVIQISDMVSKPTNHADRN
jgi:hypothetical protein